MTLTVLYPGWPEQRDIALCRAGQGALDTGRRPAVDHGHQVRIAQIRISQSRKVWYYTRTNRGRQNDNVAGHDNLCCYSRSLI